MFSGSLVEFVIRNIYPVDSNISSVKYDIQTTFPGPIELMSGSYVYRESKIALINTTNLFVGTSVTQNSLVSGTLANIVSLNFINNNPTQLNFFYNRAWLNAQAYFLDLAAGNSNIKGYTGPNVFGSLTWLINIYLIA